MGAARAWAPWGMALSSRCGVSAATRSTSSPQRYSVYLRYWYKGTNTDAKNNARYDLLATKRYGAHSEALLWPSILTFLADAQFSRALPEICRAVVGVSTHALGALGANAMRVNYLTHPSIMPPPALLGAKVICFTGTKVHTLTQKALAARLLVPLCASANASHGAQTHVHVHIINALRALVVNFPPPMHAHLQMQLPLLLEGGTCPSGAEDSALAWNARVCALVRACLEPAEEAFSVALGEALMEQRALHDGDEAMNESTNMLLGAVLSAVSADRTFVRRGLQNVFCETEHGSVMESRGCAHAFEVLTLLALLVQKYWPYWYKSATKVLRWGGRAQACRDKHSVLALLVQKYYKGTELGWARSGLRSAI